MNCHHERSAGSAVTDDWQLTTDNCFLSSDRSEAQRRDLRSSSERRSSNSLLRGSACQTTNCHLERSGGSAVADNRQLVTDNCSWVEAPLSDGLQPCPLSAISHNVVYTTLWAACAAIDSAVGYCRSESPVETRSPATAGRHNIAQHSQVNPLRETRAKVPGYRSLSFARQTKVLGTA